MFADSVRMPLKIDQSRIGVLPVAISTIIVSPTARPKPIMTAEKTPGLAVGSTTRVAVCQRLAPSASDAADRFGGHVRERVLGDGEDDRDDREAHREADDEAVALVVGEAEHVVEPDARMSPPNSQSSTGGPDLQRQPTRRATSSGSDQQDLAAGLEAASRSARGSSTPREDARACRRAAAARNISEHADAGSARRAARGTGPPRKPMTTLGSAAMISTVGLTFDADGAGGRTATCRARRAPRAGSRRAARRPCP